MQLGAPPPPVLRVPSGSDTESMQSDLTAASPYLRRYLSVPNRRTSIDINDASDPIGDLLKFQQMIDRAIDNGDLETLVVQDSDGHTYTPESFRKDVSVLYMQLHCH